MRRIESLMKLTTISFEHQHRTRSEGKCAKCKAVELREEACVLKITRSIF